jgi:hypothetical protein
MCSAKLALKRLRAASGLDVPEDLKAFIKESDPQPLQKPQRPADIAFAWHRQQQAEKKSVQRAVKRLGNEDVPAGVPGKMNIQYYRNIATSHLKRQYCMFALSFFEYLAILTYFSGTDRD